LINSNLGPISHRLVTIARTDLQGHSRSTSCYCVIGLNLRRL